MAGSLASGACDLASSLEASRIPSDIAVRYTDGLDAQVKAAMAFWTERLSASEMRPITWHRAESSATCMIDVRLVSAQMLAQLNDTATEQGTVGLAHVPGSSAYDGAILIDTPAIWVIAHEIGHTLGCEHSKHGIMAARHFNGKAPLEISDDEIAQARITRIHARLDIMAKK